jgi:hypothetical protein
MSAAPKPEAVSNDALAPADRHLKAQVLQKT